MLWFGADSITSGLECWTTNPSNDNGYFDCSSVMSGNLVSPAGASRYAIDQKEEDMAPDAMILQKYQPWQRLILLLRKIQVAKKSQKIS